MNNTPTTKQQNYLVKTIELMQLEGRTDHHFTLIQSNQAVYEGNHPLNALNALNALSHLRKTAIEQLKAGQDDIHAYLLCRYPDGCIEIVGEV